MKRKIELLAPGGDLESIKTAIFAGADAVYCGLNKFNARNRAVNISFDDLQGILRLAHHHDCEVFLTLNILIVDSEIPELIALLNKLVNTSIDGVIVQDLGVFYLLSKYFKSIKVHASTQFTTHNSGQIKFVEKLNANRVNLSRELNINEITELTAVAHKSNILTEVFVHGSYCISFSGICYMSSVHGGNSGNRGRCSQPCRDKYEPTATGKNYPLNLKDNSAYFDLKELYNAGVYSLKIEGRIKGIEYIYTIVNSWRKQLQNFNDHNSLLTDNSDLYKVFNRDFTNAFLKGNINKDMFIDNPRTHSTKHLSEINNYASNEEMLEGQKELFTEKDKVKEGILVGIENYNVDKLPLEITVSGECGSPLNVKIKTPETSFDVSSYSNLSDKGTELLNQKNILSRLNTINDTEYFIEKIDFNLGNKLYLPFKQLTEIKKKILFVLNGSKALIPFVELPKLQRTNKLEDKPVLSVLISSEKDIYLANDTTIDIYFELPNSFRSEEYIELFSRKMNLIPWFPSILIGEDYNEALELLNCLNSKYIITNNIGIAFEAHKMSIPWIAGPYLNITNSYSLKNLKENFNCKGAFISNEISKQQMSGIRKPDDFQLYYSIYHPIVLMTSRQCLFHQVGGCNKHILDNTCISKCEKYSTITNLKKEDFIINKTAGNYNTVYSPNNFLNTNIIKDMYNLFSGFMIDLRDIKTETKVTLDKTDLIQLFKEFLNGNTEAKEQIHESISLITNSQYKKGM